MEMIMISPCQLKVTMDADDMIKYDLCSPDGEMIRQNRRDALRRILNKAKDSTGFDSEGARVTVRMFPSRDGGCEMFVTLNGRASGIEETIGYKNREIAHEDMTVYSFSSFDALQGVCKRLKEADYEGESFAYRNTFSGSYYLAIEYRTPLAGEMGGVKMKKGAVAYINEHCSLICAHAVGTLQRFI